MSRSKNKTLVFGYTTAQSEKQSKRWANRRFRRRIKIQLRLGKEEFISFRALNNVWDYVKDGEHYIENVDKKYLRK